MQLLALVDAPSHVCCRYRLSAFVPQFQAAGHSLNLEAWPKSIFGRFRLCRNVRHFGAVIIQRKLLPGLLLSQLRKYAKRLIFDFDDAVFLRDSYSSKGLHDPKRQRRFRAMMRACDAVIAGNAFLARHAELHGQGTPVTVIPTCVNPESYPIASHLGKSGQTELAWIGSSSTLQGLEKVKTLLNGIGQSCPEASLRLICDRSMTLESLSVQFTPWAEETEAESLSKADIGISWIPDDDWSRGKCGLKVLQYMAAGLPVVANPVGVHHEMIRHGDNGFLAEDLEQWQSAIQCLARDPELRRRMGASGRRFIEERYSVQQGANAWLGLLEQWAYSQRTG